VEEAGWPSATEAVGAELGRRRREQGEEAGRCIEQRREKGEFSSGMSVPEGLAAFCSSLCAYCWSSHSSSCARKRRMQQGLKKPLESVLPPLPREAAQRGTGRRRVGLLPSTTATGSCFVVVEQGCVPDLSHSSYKIKRVKYTRGPSTCMDVSLRSINYENAFLGP
jgi:hypothetical protein